MVSTEEEMIRKDKEAAVLKVNHKHQVMLNLELERIEKCRRTYESSHNFEVTLMKARRDKITQKQTELKQMKTDMDWKINRIFCDNIVSRKERALDIDNSKTKSTKYQGLIGNEIAYGSEKHFTPYFRYTNAQGTLRTRKQATERGCSYATGRVTNTDVPSTTPLKSNPTCTDVTVCSSEKHAWNHGQRLYVKKTKSDQSSTKFPGLAFHNQDNLDTPALTQPVASDGPSENTSKGTVNSAKAHTFLSHSQNVKSRKSLRTTAQNMSPFDRFRLKLQESEGRTRKYKPQVLRSISAVDSSRKGARTDEVLTMFDRRIRSADIQ